MKTQEKDHNSIWSIKVRITVKKELKESVARMLSWAKPDASRKVQTKEQVAC